MAAVVPADDANPLNLPTDHDAERTKATVLAESLRRDVLSPTLVDALSNHAECFRAFV